MSRVRRKDNIVSRTIAGEVLLVPVRGKLAELHAVFALNAVGAFIWEFIGTPADESAIAGAVAGRFRIDGGRAAGDVSEFMADLRAADLIDEVQ